MQKKGANSKSERFSFRVRIKDYEVELSGNYREVMESVECLPHIVPKVNRAFESAKPKKIMSSTSKTAEGKSVKPIENSVQNYPKIPVTKKADEAVLKVLESEWGKWRPRTVEEICQAMQTSDLTFQKHTLTSALEGLSKKGLIKRWDTNTGFVYILAEQKTKAKGGK